MIICICHRVSERDIQRHAAAGCPDFSTLQDDLRVATACGACLSHAQAAFDQHAACSGCPGAARCGAQPVAVAA